MIKPVLIVIALLLFGNMKICSKGRAMVGGVTSLHAMLVQILLQYVESYT